jgi:hypothetical protein
MSEPLPTTTDARRIGSHSSDGSDGFNVLEDDGSFHIVATFNPGLDPEAAEELKAFIAFIHAAYQRLQGGAAKCSVAIELSLGNKTIRIEDELSVCQPVSKTSPFFQQRKYLFFPQKG